MWVRLTAPQFFVLTLCLVLELLGQLLQIVVVPILELNKVFSALEQVKEEKTLHSGLILLSKFSQSNCNSFSS